MATADGIKIKKNFFFSLEISILRRGRYAKSKIVFLIFKIIIIGERRVHETMVQYNKSLAL